MPIGEFELIDRYFRTAASCRSDVLLGIGDDAALLAVPPDRQLVAAIDTLVEGRHFPVGTAPHSLGHRALAVNLSDLAAMGADPAWFLLALTLPRADEDFLAQFARGMHALAQQYEVQLVGGDTTAGPLSVTVQALGLVRPGEALRRSGAQAGDLLFVSGHPGEAAAGLLLEMGGVEPPAGCDENLTALLRQRFLYPTPRLALGRALRGLASACIDVSDGLAADALKLATASGCGLRMDVGQIPLSAAAQAVVGPEAALRNALAGGDDYELCFTVPAARLAELPGRVANVKCAVTCIGVIDSAPGMRLCRGGSPVAMDVAGFDHFRSRD
jgi:thiamine-monophosphate kinase